MTAKQASACAVAVALIAGAAGAAFLFLSSAGASGFSPCTTPVYLGLWSGTWEAASTSGPTGSSGSMGGVGTWSAQLNVNLGGVLTGTLSMAQTSPSGLTLYTNHEVDGSVSCLTPANQIEVQFGNGVVPGGVFFGGRLSDDGTLWTGNFAIQQGGAGSFQGNAPADRSHVIVSCSGSQTCDAKAKSAGSARYPAQLVELIRKSTGPVQNMQLSVAVEKLTCPHTTPGAAPVVRELDSFPTGTPLTAKITLLNASHPTGWQVCYSSKAKFKTTAHPTSAAAGTGVLLTCAKSKNAAPCVSSETHAGKNVVLTVTIPNDAQGYWKGDEYYFTPTAGPNLHFSIVR